MINARPAGSSNEPLSRSPGIALSSSFIAFRCPRLSLQDVGELETRWDVLTTRKFPAAILQNSGITIVCHQFDARCLLGVNYPPGRQRDGTHTPVEYALHSWFIPLLMKRLKRWLGTLEKPVLQRASRNYAWVESLGQYECDGKGGW